MHPVLSRITFAGHDVDLGGYGLFVALGIVLSTTLMVRAGARLGYAGRSVLAVCGYTIAFGLLGAWALHLAVLALRGEPWRAGLAFYGAVPGGALGAFWSARSLQIPLLRILDSGLAAIPLGHALGRMGCFMAGCCYGAPCDAAWAVRFTHPLAPGAHPPIPRHPVELYEAAALIGVAAFYVFVPPKHLDGRRTARYVLVYASLRMVTEAFRGDVERGIAYGFSTSQWLAAFSMIVLACAAALHSRRPRRSSR